MRHLTNISFRAVLGAQPLKKEGKGRRKKEGREREIVRGDRRKERGKLRNRPTYSYFKSTAIENTWEERK